MQKTENPAVLAVILCIITGIAALLLAFSNNITKDKILKNSENEEKLALKAVMSEADSFAEYDYLAKTASADSAYDYSLISGIFEAKKGNETVGYCIKTAPSGFGGTINMMVGITTDHRISGIKIMSMSETAGLGSKAGDEAFTGQFPGKSAKGELSVVKSAQAGDNEISAITGATITSTAVKNGVNAAVHAADSIMEGGDDNE